MPSQQQPTNQRCLHAWLADWRSNDGRLIIIVTIKCGNKNRDKKISKKVTSTHHDDIHVQSEFTAQTSVCNSYPVNTLEFVNLSSAIHCTLRCHAFLIC